MYKHVITEILKKQVEVTYMFMFSSIIYTKMLQVLKILHRGIHGPVNSA